MAMVLIDGSGRTYSEDQGGTGTAPTTSATDGMPAIGLTSYEVMLVADSGQTLSGAGTVDCYEFDEPHAVWVLKPSMVMTVPASASGKRRILLDSINVNGGRGRIKHVTNGVTISSGSVTLVQIGFDKAINYVFSTK